MVYSELYTLSRVASPIIVRADDKPVVTRQATQTQKKQEDLFFYDIEK